MVLAVLAFVLATEMVLRAMGRRAHPLFVADGRYEYLMRPDQDVRYGAIRYTTNAMGLRSPGLGRKRGRRVLLIGDSVINGGQQTTQDSLASSVAARGSGVELINLSAGSWGPDNAMAWIRAHGLLEADGAIIVLSSHDAYDRMTFEPVVDVHPSYPSKPPASALGAAIAHAIHTSWGQVQAPRKRGPFVEGWRALRDTMLNADIPLTLMLHAELGELAMRHYDERGQRILDSLRTWGTPVVELLQHMDSSMYTDRIHLNDRGQAQLAALITQELGRMADRSNFDHGPAAHTR